MAGLWDPIFGRVAVRALTGDPGWLRALCAVEAALVASCAEQGLLAAESADAIAAACDEVAISDPDEVGRAAAADGNPVIPLVAALRARVPQHAADVHFGATSQDIIDTAAMLIARDVIDEILLCLQDIEAASARLAEAHRDAPMLGRTLLQQAVPTTFGAVASGWGEGVGRVVRALGALEFAVSLGGAAGTLAGWHPHGPSVRRGVADRLALVDPGVVWHAERSRIAAIAGALGLACGVLAKIATDIVLLAQDELGEVREDASGGSSAMPHKHNPIAAITARAGAAQAPGLVATLLAAMPAELQRGAGTWHAEWPALSALLDTTAGAAERLCVSIEGLHVDAAAMAARVDPSASVGHSADLVDAYLRGRTS